MKRRYIAFSLAALLAIPVLTDATDRTVWILLYTHYSSFYEKWYTASSSKHDLQEHCIENATRRNRWAASAARRKNSAYPFFVYRCARAKWQLQASKNHIDWQSRGYFYMWDECRSILWEQTNEQVKSPERLRCRDLQK